VSLDIPYWAAYVAKRAYLTGPEGIDSGMKWLMMEASITSTTYSLGGPGFFFDMVDANNYCFAVCNGNSSDPFDVYYVVAGVVTEKARDGITYDTGLTGNCDIRIAYRGGTLCAYQRASSGDRWLFLGRYDLTNSPAWNSSLEGKCGLMHYDSTSFYATATWQNVRVWSSDVDWNTDRLIRHVVTTAGCRIETPTFLIDEPTVAPEWWHDVAYRNLDLSFDLPVLGVYESLFVPFRADVADWDTMTGYAIRFYRYSATAWRVSLVLRDGTSYSPGDDLDVILVPWDRDNLSSVTCRILVKEKWITVYQNDYAVASFYNETHTAAGYVGMFCTTPGALIGNVRMPELYEWREATIIDMGSDMAGALGTVTEGRHIKFRVSEGKAQYGRFTTREDLGVWTDCLLSDQSGPDDGERLTLMRGVGTEIGDAFDAEQARENGVLFGQLQNPYLPSVEEIVAEARLALYENEEAAGYHAITGAARLDAEPEDLVRLTYQAPDLGFAVDENFVLSDISFDFSPGNLSMTGNARKKVL
jgi:hypothetical protein